MLPPLKLPIITQCFTLLTAFDLSRRTEAREELRRQLGTLRFDLNSLATAKTGKEEKKKALALRKDFIRSVSNQTRRLCICCSDKQM